jgi:hypothetical protein
MIKTHSFGSSQEAWEGINEYFLTQEQEVVDRGGTRTGSQLLSYNHFIDIHRAWINPDFDFGKMFGYTPTKWTHLISNYINMAYLSLVKSEVIARELKNSKQYNISFNFSNSHGSGKGCLLSCTFVRRPSVGYPILLFNLRSSEVVKRLAVDFLLLQRIGEYVYGDTKFGLQLFCGNLYTTAEFSTMYNTHKKLRKIITDRDNLQPFQTKVLEIFKRFKTVDPATIKYKVHLRAVKRLQPELFPVKPFLAKDCYLSV